MSNHIEQHIVDNILSASKIEDVISDFVILDGQGKTKYGKCPMCGKEGKGKGIQVTPSKQVYKCFSCDFSGISSVKFLMETQKMDYPGALRYLAQKYSIAIPTDPKPVKLKKRNNDKTFKNKQLQESGLTVQDVKAIEYRDDNTKVELNVFESGTVNDFHRIVDGDDMIIRYLDLYGKRVVYQVKENDKNPREFYRVRWQAPESHPLRSGEICKYKTPYGASTQLYIPQTLRNLFNENRETKRLFFTEGEKKAEKMCKHGLPAFGMPGINSFVGKNKVFPDSVVKFIERCNVKEVFIVLDSDFRELSKTITPEKDITQRSKNFYYAVKNFRDWFKSLANRKLYVDVFFLGGRGDQKGIDDLLANTFTDRETEFINEVNQAVNGIMEAESGQFEHFELHKISTVTDLKLLEIWKLNDRKAFCTAHLDRLKYLSEFKYGSNLWRYDEIKAEFVLAQPLYDDEKFWKETPKTPRYGDEYIEVKFDYAKIEKFLHNRGFFRLETGNREKPFEFIRITNGIIRSISHYDARDFCMDLLREITPESVWGEIKQGGKMYFGPDQLSYIRFYHPSFIKNNKDCENIFFNNKYWKISADGIQERFLNELEGDIFYEQIKQFDVQRTNRLVSVSKIDKSYFVDRPVIDELLGKYDVKFSPDGHKCHYAQFLFLTGNFSWQKYYDDDRNPIENKTVLDDEFLIDWAEQNLHFLSKMTAIGYLLHKYRDRSNERAIVGMDGKMSDVDEANGRTGKSLFGMGLGKMLNQVVLDGRQKNQSDDKHLWEEVNRKTESIFIDDALAGYDIGELFNIITGRLTVNKKGIGRFTLTGDDVPKLYITTNHTFKGSSDSFKARQFRLAFCDFFDASYQPKDVFKHNFWEEWEHEQWNLFYNFMAECLELYFISKQNQWGIAGSGLIEAPVEMLEKRHIRQEMGEMFFSWFNDYLGVDDQNHDEPLEWLNYPHVRNVLYQNFIEKCPSQKNHMTAQKFWKKVTLYCKYYNFRLNPAQTLDQTKPMHDKRSGMEYITIANKHFEKI